MTVSIAEARSATAQFDLSLDMAEADGRLYGSLDYNADLFEQSTIDRLLGHYGAILEAMAHHPDRRISEIEILSAAEQPATARRLERHASYSTRQLNRSFDCLKQSSSRRRMRSRW
jgi:non-ribosomal peptide synthetase component F